VDGGDMPGKIDSTGAGFINGGFDVTNVQNNVFNDIKNEIMNLFDDMGTANKKYKLEDEQTNTEEVFIGQINKYLSDKDKIANPGKHTRHAAFGEKLDALVKKELSVTGRYYEAKDCIYNRSIKYHQLVKKDCSETEGTQPARAQSTAPQKTETQIRCEESEVAGNTSQDINKLKAEIKSADEQRIALEDLKSIVEPLIYIFYQVFPDKNKAVNSFEHVFSPKENILENNDLDTLKEYLKKVQEYNAALTSKITSAMESLPTVERNVSLDMDAPAFTDGGLNHLQNKIIPDVLEIIKPAIEIILSHQLQEPEKETFWRQIVNTIVRILFPSLLKEMENKKISREELVNFRGLILELKDKKDYQNVTTAPWAYNLACNLLNQCIPAQYPFDPLNVLSPDRKVWLNLQKEWQQPLEDI
jgi:hypothetical protein